jgi:hypothetical protein
MTQDCQPCKERGRTTPGERSVGGEWMCRWCFAGFDGPEDPTIGHTSKKVSSRGLKKKREQAMPKKIEIDEERLKQLHAQGVGAAGTAKELGCSRSMIYYSWRRLHLTPNRGTSQASGKSGGSRQTVLPKSARQIVHTRDGDDALVRTIAILESDRAEIDVVIEFLKRQLGP